jgi:hypothetical protein
MLGRLFKALSPHKMNLAELFPESGWQTDAPQIDGKKECLSRKHEKQKARSGFEARNVDLCFSFRGFPFSCFRDNALLSLLNVWLS